MSVRTDQHGDAAAAYAMAIYRWLNPAIEVTVGGMWGTDAVGRMMFAAAALPYPNVVILQAQLAEAAQLAEDDTGKAWAEACLDTMCLAPVTDPAQLRPVVMEYLRGQIANDLDDLPVVTLLSPPA